MGYTLLITSMLANILFGLMLLANDAFKWGEDKIVYEQVIEYIEPITAVEFIDAECREEEYRRRMNWEFGRANELDKQVGDLLIEKANLENELFITNIKLNNHKNNCK